MEYYTKKLAILVLLAVLTSLLVVDNFASANFMPFNMPPHNIEISTDGAVNGTDRIQCDKTVYTLTGNISGSIVILCDGITIDGAGYTL